MKAVFDINKAHVAVFCIYRMISFSLMQIRLEAYLFQVLLNDFKIFFFSVKSCELGFICADKCSIAYVITGDLCDIRQSWIIEGERQKTFFSKLFYYTFFIEWQFNFSNVFCGKKSLA